MKIVLFVTSAVCVLQFISAAPLQEQVKVDPRDDLVQVQQSDLEQVTESKLDFLPDESEPKTIQIDDGGLMPTELIPELEQDEAEQEVQQVQKQDFQDVQNVQDVQLVTATDDNSDEDGQSTERSVEDQSEESWFCSVFGCNKS